MKCTDWKKGCVLVIGACMLAGILQGQVQAEGNVVRNERFTTTAEMQKKTNTMNLDGWMPKYLTTVEGDFWNFAGVEDRDNHTISTNLASNAYQNLEMFLDNGYEMDYNVLQEYIEDYRERAGREDTFYLILKDCLNNPYLHNRPESVVTDTTYNGRDYASVFDARYYYDHNPDLQQTIGMSPSELLRHFVECGINEGRAGNASFSITAYASQVNYETAMQVLGTYGPSAADGLGKYSYSPANYYGKYLGHYQYESMFADTMEEEY
ncbi:MAG: hypothetical protein PHE02_04600 [Lachnospiraceae bacterium]|nr:hypothetical protein [Lachnospiraceae bacterium]